MLNQSLKDLIVDRLLPRVQTPAQYTGGEWNAVVKDHRTVRGTLCLAFPDAYSIGMSNHGLQVLYDVMNRRDGLGLRAGVLRRLRTWSNCSANTACHCTVWKPSRRFRRSTCSASRCNTTSATATS